MQAGSGHLCAARWIIQMLRWSRGVKVRRRPTRFPGETGDEGSPVPEQGPHCGQVERVCGQWCRQDSATRGVGALVALTASVPTPAGSQGHRPRKSCRSGPHVTGHTYGRGASVGRSPLEHALLQDASYWDGATLGGYTVALVRGAREHVTGRRGRRKWAGARPPRAGSQCPGNENTYL